MDSVKIVMPKPEDTTGLKIKSFLKQLELCVHHLQKSVDQMEQEGNLSDNTFIIWRFPFLERQDDENNMVSIHVDSISDQMQEIELEIVTT